MARQQQKHERQLEIAKARAEGLRTMYRDPTGREYFWENDRNNDFLNETENAYNENYYDYNVQNNFNNVDTTGLTPFPKLKTRK